jgi:hypothetical protein
MVAASGPLNPSQDSSAQPYEQLPDKHVPCIAKLLAATVAAVTVAVTKQVGLLPRTCLCMLNWPVTSSGQRLLIAVLVAAYIVM